MIESSALAPAKGLAKFKVHEVIDAIDEAHGLVSVAARRLGCHPETVRNYVKRHPTVAQALKDARDHTTDIAEQALFKAIQKGEGWAVCFYLKTQGKSRGYVERQDYRIDTQTKTVSAEVKIDIGPEDAKEALAALAQAGALHTLGLDGVPAPLANG